MISTSHPNGAKGDNSPSGAMAEVLGQRSLLGFGVVLAWLVLFHLLVNIWLLCVFSSLLVVLGSWLASQAVLESNNVVHLERFITFEQVPSSVDDEHQLDEEIHKTVRKIIRDFVTSWYSTVSSECGFEKEVQKAMTSLAMELKLRARQIDRKELTQRVLDLFGSHLQDYIQAKELVEEQQTSPVECWSVESEGLWNAYSRVAVPHLAMTSDVVEVNYTRAVVDLLLYVLVPSPHLETRTGRFVVGELITCNVLLPFIVKMSDPDWINSLLIQLCGSSGRPEEQSPPDSFTSSPSIAPLPAQSEFGALQEATPQRSLQNNLSADTEMVNGTEIATPDSAGYDVIDSVDAGYPHNTTEEDPAGSFLRHYMGGRKLNPFYQENDTDPDSPFADYKQISADSLVAISQEEALCVRQKECITFAENNHGVDLEDVSPSLVEVSGPRVLVNSQPAEGTPSVRAGVGTLSISSLQDLDREGFSPSITTARELLLSVDHGALGNHSELTEVSSLPTSSPLPSFSFEPLSSPEGPVLIQNLRITGTITAKEHRGTGSHPYTLYTIKYETAVGCETPGSIQEGPEDVEVVLSACEQPVAYHMVNRRYSEFLNLQTRLEEKTELRKLIKGVKGPKKIFPDMPFGNMDSDKIEARKGLLETFLKQLCAISEIANSEEMQEFLALNTDARIAFVKKPFIVSRIDKIVVNAIVDTLKTAFPRSEPQSPTEENEGEVDGVKLSSDKKSKTRLKFSSKNIPFMNGSDIRPVQFSCEQTSAVFNRMSLRGLEDFLTEQENLASRTEPEREDTPAVRKHYLHGSFSGEHSREPASETALAEVVLNILCLLMKEQWSWLCTENMQKTIRLLFGTLINRWLDVSVANLMCARYWVVYLQVIQEAVWPGGSLPTAPQTERSQQEKDNTRREALHCLMGLLPDLVSDMLGSDKYKLSWQTALESLQDPYINRHLVYCITDLLLDFLVPEIPQEEFQRKLLQTLLKNPEKLPA